MTRRCGSSQPTPRPLPCEATKPHGNDTTENHKRRTEDGKNGTEHSSEWQDRQAQELSLLQLSEGKGVREKGKRELCRKIERKTKMRKRWVRRWKSQRPREQNPKRSQKRTRMRYVRNSTGARGMDIVPHPAGATSKLGGKLPGKSPQGN